MDKEIKELEEMSDYNTDPSWDDLYEAWKDEEHKNMQLKAENARLRKAGEVVIQLWDEIEKYVEIEKACTDAGWMAGYFAMVDRMAELREACGE